MALDLSLLGQSRNVELSNTGYTAGYVLDMINNNSKKFVAALGNSKVKNISAHDISEGKGYISRVYRTVVGFDDPNRKPYEFMLKIPTLDSFEEALLAMKLDGGSIDYWKDLFLDSHNVECNAYALITRVKGFPIPEIYCLDKGSGKYPGMIAMESFYGSTITIGAYKSMTSELVLSAARYYAHLQAEVNFMEGWRGKFPSNFHVSVSNDTEWPKIFTKFDEAVPEYREKTKKMLSIDINPFCQYAILGLAKKYNALTFTHGDNWSNNILIKANDDGSVSNQILALIDWQMSAEASPMLDLARFMSHNCDGDVRRETEDKALNVYYKVLSKGYASRNENVPFTREQARELYDIAYIHQAFEIVIIDCLITGKDFENNPHLHQARAQKLHLRAKFAIDDALLRMEKYGIFEKFRRSSSVKA